MTTQRRHFDISLKLEVVRMIKEQGLSASQVSMWRNMTDAVEIFDMKPFESKRNRKTMC